MATSVILIQSVTVISMDSDFGDLVDVDILINNGVITDIASSLSPPKVCQILNARGCIAIPGFVDVHRHSWEAILRTLHPNSRNLEEYILPTLGTFGPQFRPQDIFVATRATALAAIDAGITAIVDNMHCNATEAHRSAAVKAWVESGLDVIVALATAPVTLPVPPAPSKEEIKHLVEKHANEIPITEKSRVEVGIWGRMDRNEIEVSQELNVPYVQELFHGLFHEELLQAKREGWLRNVENKPRFIFNHVSGLGDPEWEIIKELGGAVNVCPRSDSQWALGGGFCGWDDAVARKIRPGISTDNELAYGGEMFSEMRVLFYTQRALCAKLAKDKKEGSPLPKPIEVRAILEGATVNGAQAIGKGDQLGRLIPGMVASLVLLRASGLSHYPAHSAVGQVVLSMDRSNVDTVIVRGKVLKRDGNVIGVDWPKIKQEMDESMEYLKRRIGDQSERIMNLAKV